MMRANTIHAALLPSQEQVREQLERILTSPTFQLSRRGRRFLEFVVNETLEARHGYLKAFTIAQEVFGRDAHFDAQRGPTVRIEAGRVRKQLERYYLVDGVTDPILIEVPKGTYVPTFQFTRDFEPVPTGTASPPSHPRLLSKPASVNLKLRSLIARYRRWGLAVLTGVIALTALSAATNRTFEPQDRGPDMASAVPGRPSVVVSGLDCYSEQPDSCEFSSGITDQIIQHLALSESLMVKVALPRPQNEQLSPSAPYSIEGNVALEQRKLRVVTRLVRQLDRAVLWTKIYDIDVTGRSRFDIQAEIAADIPISIEHPISVSKQATS